jgi:hypothetical protein
LKKFREEQGNDRLQVEFEYLHKASIIKLDDLEVDYDDEFYKTTQPNITVDATLTHFSKHLTKKGFIQEYMEEAEFVIL